MPQPSSSPAPTAATDGQPQPTDRPSSGTGASIDSTVLKHLAACLEDLQETKRWLSSVQTSLSQAIADMMDRKILEVGPYTLEKRRTTKREWDHDLLSSKVVEVAMEAGTDPLEAIRRVAAFSYWRIGALQGMGLDPYAYCSTTRGPWTATVSRSGGHADSQAGPSVEVPEG